MFDQIIVGGILGGCLANIWAKLLTEAKAMKDFSILLFELLHRVY